MSKNNNVIVIGLCSDIAWSVELTSKIHEVSQTILDIAGRGGDIRILAENAMFTNDFAVVLQEPLFLSRERTKIPHPKGNIQTYWNTPWAKKPIFEALEKSSTVVVIVQLEKRLFPHDFTVHHAVLEYGERKLVFKEIAWAG
jgi:hypothetical protein